VLSLSTTPLSLSSKTTLLPVGLSTSSNNFLPKGNPSFTNSLAPFFGFQLLIKEYLIASWQSLN
jgi:hypothetical protein